ncbi:MAG: DUF4332 domain-containing protein [Chloroflexota bacterium]|nr:MAG: DUF4332 domain-containing protein [Chloroflexota bacterium]
MASAELSAQETRATPWWLVLIEGIALILVGILLLTRTGMSTLILVQVLGIYWMIMGLVRIVSIFIDSAQWGWKLFAGILGIIAGIIVIQHPLWSTAVVLNTVILVLGLTGVVIGLISVVQAFQGAGWGAGIMGVISVILGFVLLANRMELSFSLPITFGILAIIGGIVAIFSAFRLRREEHELASQAAAVEPEAAAEEAPAVAEEVAAPEAEAEAQTAAVAAAAVVAAEPEETAVPEEAAAEPVADGPAAEEAPELEHHALQHIEGIGPVYAETLAANGIDSTESLLTRGATPKGRSEIAEQTGISGKLVLTWVNHVDLMRIKGVGSQYADLLEEAGVDTVPELAQRNPANLYEKILAINEEKKLVRHVPAQAQVQDWVAMAKELPRIIEY